jgi:hypothetical protein
MSVIGWYKKYANVPLSLPSWEVLVTFGFDGEERYAFLREIPSSEVMGLASFPPTAEEMLEIARYEADRQGELPKEYVIALTFYKPIDGLRERRLVFTSAQIRGK